MGSTGLQVLSGSFTTYNGVATALDGIEYIVGAPAITNGHTSISTSNILASTVAGETMYRFGYTLYQITAGSGGTCSTPSTVAVTLGWTDNSGTAQTQTFSTLGFGPTLAAGAYQNNELVMLLKPSSAITYSMTYTNGNCGSAPNIKIQPYAQEF